MYRFLQIAFLLLPVVAMAHVPRCVCPMAFSGASHPVYTVNVANEQVLCNYFYPCGNVNKKVDAASRRINYRYDVLNRCTNTVYADGSNEAFGKSPVSC